MLVPLWLVAVIGVLFWIWVVRRILLVGRVQGFRYCLTTILNVGELMANEDNRPLDPAEADVAQAIDAIVPAVVEHYARQQARAATPSQVQKH